MDQSTVREFRRSSNVSAKKDRLALILAGGEGSRLRSLTKMITGDERPKQFCPVIDNRTLLDLTRQRVALKFEPKDTYFSLTQKHAAYYERPLWNVPRNQKIAQPENKGTAPAILYSLMRIAQGSPDASVAIFPSDHYFSDDAAFMDNVDAAFSAAEINPNSIVLIGIEPAKPEVGYGWIEPDVSLFGGLSRSISGVRQFWEKPTAGVAAKLMSMGCLWNSFVMIGKIPTFVSMFERNLPEMVRTFVAAAPTFDSPQEAAVVRSVYSWISETNFSSEVLERSPENLMVMRVGDIGWSDLGEPQRVLGTLSALGVQTEWMQALAA